MALLTEKQYHTDSGTIFYRVNTFLPDRKTLVLLHGIGADGRMMIPQARMFNSDYNLFVWDAPAHGRSRPFSLTFSYMDIAKWLHEILESEGVNNPVLIGHSMGGYYAQCFMERYPGEAAGFVSIDSGPMQKHYMTEAELWSLEHTELMYRAFPWSLLLNLSARGNATSEYGRRVCRKIFEVYGKDELCRLLAYGFRQVAKAIREDLSYQIDCPCVLICGKKDHLGVVKSKNRLWARETGYPIHWIEGAGHCSNLDAPDEVNALIRAFVAELHI